MKNYLFLLVFGFYSLTSIAQEIENLKVDWPEEYEWKIGSNQEDESVHFIELIPENEDINNWSIIGTMMSVKGATNVPMELARQLFFQQTVAISPNAKMKVLESNDEAENPYTIFTIESPNFVDDEDPESQLYYIVQGKSSLYTNFVAIKKATLSTEFVEKWTAIFKASEFVYQ